MKQYQVKFQTSTRMRIQLDFPCTLDVQLYLDSLRMKFSKIQKIHFYHDEYHIAIHFDKGYENHVFDFLHRIERSIVKRCLLYPEYKQHQTPYTIVSNAVYKRVLTKLFVPQPFKSLLTLYKAVKFGKAAFHSLHHKQLDMNVLDFTAISISILMNDYPTADTIMFLLGVGEDLDRWSHKKSIDDLERNLNNQQYEVWIEINGVRKLISSQDIQLGDHVVVNEGQEIYYDGTVVSGHGFVNESSLTGESFPVLKEVGHSIYSNTTLEHGELIVEVTNTQANSRLKHLVELIKNSETTQSVQQKYLTCKADKLVKYNFIGFIVTFILTQSFSKALSFLLVDYSCALKLATPITYLTAIKDASDKGVVIKGSSYLDTYQEIDTFVFDKTGTLTTGIPTIQKIIPFNGHEVNEVLRIAACLEEHIYHPIANAVVEKAKDNGIIHEEMHGELAHIASKGIRSSIDGIKVVIGSKIFLEEEGVKITEEQQEIIQTYQNTYNLLYLGFGKNLIALFCIETPLREDAIISLERLKAAGKTLTLLTGDTPERTQSLRDLFEFDEVYTQVTPQDKYAYIQQKKAEGNRVLMIGDGLNDSAALSYADIGVVMADSSDVARQASDIILLSDRLNSLNELFTVGSCMQERLDKNLTLTIQVNSVLIALGIFNVLPPSTLAILHNLTTVGIVAKSFTYIDKNIK